MTRVIVLGAGPAGLATALELAERGVEVSLLERLDRVGGNAGSFEFAGVQVDYGSHRLHPAADPQVLSRLRGLLGDDLLVRPRHGRIRLLGRWLHFPLQPLDLLLRVHPRFALGVAGDLVRKLGPRAAQSGEGNFASVLERGLGETICREFYFPYARKIWGIDPIEISAVQAQKRVSANSLGKMIRRLLPGGTGSGAANTKGKFFYPRRGYGQICDALRDAAIEAGADVRLETRVSQVRLDQGTHYVELEREEAPLQADQIFSTIPITRLTQLISPAAPDSVDQAAKELDFRALVLVYLAIDQDRFTEFDAHYFPEPEFAFSRISEPKNYSNSSEPRGRTVLCAELPCDRGGSVWSQSDVELGELVREGLERAGLPIRAPVTAVTVRRLPFAYPIYRTGYQQHFETIDRWLASCEGILTFGRQGLYAHDNTHHAIYMAQAAARCLRDDGSIDSDAWTRERAVFETHVVED